MEWLSDPELWVAFLTLTALEIVLGIDNIIFISILVSRLPKAQQASGRIFGLGLAMLTRIGLLLSITWVMGLTADLFQLPIMDVGISGRDLILFFGGLFLLFKSSTEIFFSFDQQQHTGSREFKAQNFWSIIVQIAIIDIVFSLDSVITAVGLVQNIPVMVAAIMISVAIMMLASGTISAYIDRHPSLKMLALSFLIVVGVVLIGESFDTHVPKGYIYFAMAFSLGVEMLNIRLRTRVVAAPGEEQQPSEPK